MSEYSEVPQFKANYDLPEAEVNWYNPLDDNYSVQLEQSPYGMPDDNFYGNATPESYYDNGDESANSSFYRDFEQQLQSRAQNDIVQKQDNTQVTIAGGYRITSPFGKRKAPNAKASTDHKGIDIGTPLGTQLYVPSGKWIVEKVVQVSNDGGGTRVKITNKRTGYSLYYTHLTKNSIQVKPGDIVNGGTRLAKTGNTGNSTGPHLHLSCIKNNIYVDPMSVQNLINESLTQITKNGGTIRYAKIRNSVK